MKPLKLFTIGSLLISVILLANNESFASKESPENVILSAANSLFTDVEKNKEMYEKILGEEVNYSLFDIKDSSNIPKLNQFFDTVDGLSITAPYKGHFLKDVKKHKFVIIVEGIKK